MGGETDDTERKKARLKKNENKSQEENETHTYAGQKF